MSEIPEYMRVSMESAAKQAYKDNCFDQYAPLLGYMIGIMGTIKVVSRCQESVRMAGEAIAVKNASDVYYRHYISMLRDEDEAYSEYESRKGWVK